MKLLGLELGKCAACKKTRFLKNRRVYIPMIKQYATSQVLLCRQCGYRVEDAIQKELEAKVQ